MSDDRANGAGDGTDSSDTSFRMTEESFEEFSTKMGTTVDDLGTFRDRVFRGTVVGFREGADPERLNGSSFQDVDTVNLPFGGFDDATELQDVYKNVFYPTRAEQIDRVSHALDTGRTVSEDIKNGYLESDGDVTADVVSVQSEFGATGGGLTESDVEEAEDVNAGEDEEDTSTTGEEPASGEEPTEVL